MTTPPGRTYRYYTDKPLFTFGSGLSYTTFAITCSGESVVNSTTVVMAVENILPIVFVYFRSSDDHSEYTGTRDGDEVVLVYHRVSADLAKKLTQPGIY